jgi:SPOR domain
MAEDQHNRAGVNLEELERQLRIASRAHAEATERSFPQSSFGPTLPILPNIEALRRDYAAQVPHAADAPVYPSSPLPGPGFPPAFLSSSNYPPNSAEYENPFEERFPLIDRRGDAGSSLFRSLVGIVAIIILGSFGYFFYSGKLSLNVSVTTDQKAVPVIKPDPGPIKIVPDTANSNDTTPAGSELFGKKGADTVGSATTKSSVEAPVDINAVVKNAAPKANGLVPGMGEPRSVRTVTVKPDGTLIGDPTTTAPASSTNATPVIATPPASAMSQEASSASAESPLTAVPQASVQQPASKISQSVAAAAVQPAASGNLPALPKEPATLNGGPVPLPPVRPVNDEMTASADDPLRDLVAEAAKSEPVKAEVKPSDTAQSATDTPITGEWTVQFGASPSEGEANSLVNHLKSQLSNLLGDHELAVIRADINGKPMFRVRALGYTRDEAGATCATSAAAGTKCFIAKN